jgi:DNA transformation protein
VGIDSEEKLKSIGSLDAFLRMRTKGLSPCVNTLYALEGAIKNMRWHNLSWESRSYLKSELDKYSKKK